MPVSQPDPKTALILIDLQKGIVSQNTVHPMAGVLENAGNLAEAFRSRGLPVALVNVTGAPPGRTEQPRPAAARPEGWDELVPELNAQPGDHRVTKRAWGAFSNTGLEALLKNLGVTQVVLAGVSTSIGVESTAREAYGLGFHVTLATDAMTDTRAEAHHNSLTLIFPRLGETGSSAEIIGLLGKGLA